MVGRGRPAKECQRQPNPIRRPKGPRLGKRARGLQHFKNAIPGDGGLQPRVTFTCSLARNNSKVTHLEMPRKKGRMTSTSRPGEVPGGRKPTYRPSASTR